MVNSEIRKYLIEIIITKPLQEYTEYINRLIRNPGDNEARDGISEIESFFRSEPIIALTGSDGTEVIEKIHLLFGFRGVRIADILDTNEHSNVQ